MRLQPGTFVEAPGESAHHAAAPIGRRIALDAVGESAGDH